MGALTATIAPGQVSTAAAAAVVVPVATAAAAAAPAVKGDDVDAAQPATLVRSPAATAAAADAAVEESPAPADAAVRPCAGAVLVLGVGLVVELGLALHVEGSETYQDLKKVAGELLVCSRFHL